MVKFTILNAYKKFLQTENFFWFRQKLSSDGVLQLAEFRLRGTSGVDFQFHVVFIKTPVAPECVVKKFSFRCPNVRAVFLHRGV